MAQFKLFLLTPSLVESNENNQDFFLTQFLETKISDFHNSVGKNNNDILNKSTILNDKNIDFNYCYTFDENISFHKNNQKELTFSMLKNIWKNDELIINPFALSIHNGSQLLLIDKFNNEFFFTVNSINYSLQENNLMYKVSCQDSFSYQTIRQNAGYTIDNSPDSSDFIGAQTIDWWVLNKIQPECHIGYNYIPLFQGLFLDKNNNVQLFTNQDHLQNVQKIIKKPYDQNLDKEFFETIPFSISGSNTSAALIALGECLGLSLNTCEHALYIDNKTTGKYSQYFWFEPEKKEDFTGLYYSPYQDIQDFNFSHKGDALTTVLNVESNTINDEVISLLPEVPPFFMNLFNSKDWEESKNKFSQGYFSSICKNQIFKGETGDLTSDLQFNDIVSQVLDSDVEITEQILKNNFAIKNHLFLKINNNNKGFYLSSYYNKINFRYDNEDSSLFLSGHEETLYNSKWEFVIFKKIIKDGTVTYQEYNYDISSIIPGDTLGENWSYAFIKIIPFNFQENISVNTILTQIHLIINFYRDVSEEEMQFAKIADLCPWLENKIIDFSYFYNQNIINKFEYNELMKIVQNDLRIANGKLLLYSKDYFDALHDRTAILANITETADVISAAFNADVIDYYANNGTVTNIDYFNNTYNNRLDIYMKQSEPKRILNYNQLLDDYTNKYLNAQQRFLKNVYNFRALFDSRVSIDNKNAAVTDYIFNLQDSAVGDWEFSDIINWNKKDATNQSIIHNVEYDIDFESNGTSFNKLSLIDQNIKYGDVIVYTGVTQTWEDINYQKIKIISTKKLQSTVLKTLFNFLNDNNQSFSRKYISFSSNDFKTITNNFELYNKNTGEPYVTIYSPDKKEIIEVINENNYQNFYRRRIDEVKVADRCEAGKHNANFSARLNYYKLVLKKPIDNYSLDLIKVIPEDNTALEIDLQFFKKDDKNIYYQTIIPDSDPTNPLLNYINKEISFVQKDTKDPIKLVLYYIPVTKNEIINEYLYALKYKDNNAKEYWYYRNNKEKDSVLKFFDDKKIEFLIKDYLSPNVLLASFNKEDYNNEQYNVLKDAGVKSRWSNKYKITKSWLPIAISFYKSHFPVETIYYIGGQYVKIPYKIITKNNTVLEGHYQRANKKGKTMIDYYNYLKNSNTVGQEIIDNPFDYQREYTLQLVTPQNENNYYRRITVSDNITFDRNSLKGISTQDNCNLINNGLWNESESRWDVSGLNDKDFFGEPFINNGEAIYYQGYNDTKAINYTTSPDSYDNFMNILNERIKNDYFKQMYIKTIDDASILQTAPSRTTDFCIYYEDPIKPKETKGIFVTPLKYEKIDNVENYTDLLDYFNYYNLVGLTYSGLQTVSNAKKISYKDSWLRLVKKDDLINKNMNYKMLITRKKTGDIWNDIVFNDNNKKISFIHNQNGEVDKFNFNNIIINNSDTTKTNTTTTIRRWSQNLLFPLFSLMNTIDFNVLDWESKKERSLLEALSDNGYNITSNEDEYLITIKTPNDLQQRGNYVSEIEILIFVVEDFKYTPILSDTKWENIANNKYLSSNQRNNIYTSVPIIDIKTSSVIDFDKEPNLVEGFYTLSKLKSDFEDNFIFSFKDDNSNKYNYYNKKDYSRIYTINDIKLSNKYKFLVSSSMAKTELTSDKTDFSFKVFLHKEEKIKDKGLNRPQVIEYPDFIHFKYQKDFEDQIQITYNNEIYSINYKSGQNIKEKLYGITNGQFWYLYHNRQDIPALEEKSASIETELSQYWEQAVTASKYCEFFLPNHWQFIENGNDNFFSSNIFAIQGKNIKLKNIYLPIVKIYKEEGKILLPNYRLTSVQKRPQMRSTTQQIVDNNYIKTASSINNNPAYKNAFAELHFNLSEWYIEPNGNKTFYYTDEGSGGIKWYNILDQLAISHNHYDLFNGLYLMYINLLQNYFVNKDISKNYENALTEHNNIWSWLYKYYPNVILENTYSNTDATTSEELLQLASFYFKDLSEPERNYNITIIDSQNLKGYLGQEIKIGDIIKINAEEYYDEYDDVKTTLSKPLFVTDIAYSLRVDNDIKLTVNSIKYQDKLIQRLVKLIK